MELNSPRNSSRDRSPQYLRFEDICNVPRKQIHNMLSIDCDMELSLALKVWDRKEASLRSKVDEKEKQFAALKNEIVNIVWFFIAFQGVVLTVVAQLKSSNEPLCGMVWVPALLSAVGAMVTIIGLLINFSPIEGLEVSIYNEKTELEEVAARTSKLRELGRDFNFLKHAPEIRPFRKPKFWISTSRIWVILSVIFFTGLFILSYVVILCNSLTVHKWNKHLLPT